MAEYIEREAAFNAITDLAGKAPTRSAYEAVWKSARALKKIPAADVAPVVYTRWAHLGGDEWCCPVCGFVITTEGSWDKPTKKYCEDCGAKMDGGAGHEAG
mgnify:CR=1 FL=1